MKYVIAIATLLCTTLTAQAAQERVLACREKAPKPRYMTPQGPVESYIIFGDGEQGRRLPRNQVKRLHKRIDGIEARLGRLEAMFEAIFEGMFEGMFETLVYPRQQLLATAVEAAGASEEGLALDRSVLEGARRNTGSVRKAKIGFEKPIPANAGNDPKTIALKRVLQSELLEKVAKHRSKSQRSKCKETEWTWGYRFLEAKTKEKAEVTPAAVAKAKVLQKAEAKASAPAPKKAARVAEEKKTVAKELVSRRTQSPEAIAAAYAAQLGLSLTSVPTNKYKVSKILAAEAGKISSQKK